MVEYVIRKINNLLTIECKDLWLQSRNKGFHFIERLIHEYKSGTNTFHKRGEALYGVFDQDNTLIAIGGVNIDPFSSTPTIGRLRRFYVKKTHRRLGLGSLLVKRIILEATDHFNVLILFTDTERADRFYTSLGFLKSNRYPHSTHYMDL
ncbi:GNAT family N-acetyltransferase [Ornithinibacillus massiliensis]|uniref:GNAT family N-acetyltransferase n=1 Tax=Ornithinibacillus massiliensis TaxID=1944633 RepID=A0ABS5MFL2_9BACI|nr:GNAT family N-acetyltransferase [Ornithinibacillus massiliensis]MBS3680863.1 GNAT family N-acetyltransferase [Ornithinibacillus massiliensis]